MLILKSSALVSSVALALAPLAIAQEGPDEVGYLADLDMFEIDYGTAETGLGIGYSICDAMRQGRGYEVDALFWERGLHKESYLFFIFATKRLCPDMFDQLPEALKGS